MMGILTTSLLLAQVVFATDFPVVKVRSFLCKQPDRVRLGSGVPFQKDGTVHVLTSSHILFHGGEKDGVCHEVLQGKLKFKAHLQSVHSGYGLAALATSGSIDSLPLDALFSTRAPSGASGHTLAGYPVGIPVDSTTPEYDREAQVLDWKCKQSILPSAKTMIKAKVYSAFGMTGGGLFSSEGLYLGLQSHHKIKVEEAKPGKIRPFLPSEQWQAFIAFIIPRETVASWFRAAVLEKKPEASLPEILEAQLKGRSAFLAAGMKFEEQGKKPAGTGTGGEAVGTGGEAVGTGGEAVGTGGAEAEPPTAILVSSSLLGDSIPWPLLERGWVTELKAMVHKHGTVAISALDYQDALHPVSDLWTTLALIENGYQPIKIPVRSRAADLPKEEAQLVAITAEAKTLLSELGTPNGTERVVRQLTRVFTLIESGDYGRVGTAVDDLLDYEQDTILDRSWAALQDKDFEKTKRLMTALYRLQAALRRLK